MDYGAGTIALGLLLVVVVVLVWVGIEKTWEQHQKDRRILTQGTVTSIRTQKIKVSVSTTTVGFTSSHMQDTTEVTMGFEFYVGGQRWTGRKSVHGDLATKNKGDSILVYYLPEDPGRDQMLDP